MRQGVRFRAAVFLLLSLCILLTCCGISEPAPLHKGETYLDGSWYQETLPVGYNLFPNGGGYQFIGGSAVPIRYGILNSRIYIQSSDGGTAEFTFEKTGDGCIWIEGLRYLPVEENPEAVASIELMLSQAEQTSSQETAASRDLTALRFFALACAAIVVALIVRFLRKKKGMK